MATRTLIDAAALAALLGDARLRLFDCRFDFARPDYGRAAYLDEHLLGAIHADLNTDLAAPVTATSGRHPLPAPEQFAARLRAWGVNADSRVVAYDDGNGAYASRLWWMLRWLGHEAVTVLDGGYERWVREGRPAGTELPVPRPATFLPRPVVEPVGTAEVGASLGRDAVLVIDARGGGREREKRLTSNHN